MSFLIYEYLFWLKGGLPPASPADHGLRAASWILENKIDNVQYNFEVEFNFRNDSGKAMLYI